MKVFNDVKLHKTIEQAINAERIVGTSIIVAKEGEIIFEKYAGWADRENKKPVNENTAFRLTSMTKPLVSCAALALVEKGLMQLDDPITNWLPDFTPQFNGRRAYITLRHLLTHTSGLSYGFLSANNEPYLSAGISDGFDERTLSLEENLRRLANVPLMFEPGTNWCYSLSTDVLGAVLEKICQQPLPEIVRHYVTKPLDMVNTGFTVIDPERFAKAYADSLEPGGKARPMQVSDQVLLSGCGPIHYAPGRINNPNAYFSGGSGMIGTAGDYLKFLEMIRQGGQSILNETSVKWMTEDAVQDFEVPAAGPGCGFGMGFAVIRDPKVAGTPRQVGSYDWGGVYGTKMFVDPKMGLTVIILTNTALEGLMGFYSEVANAIYEGLIPQAMSSNVVIKEDVVNR